MLASLLNIKGVENGLMGMKFLMPNRFYFLPTCGTEWRLPAFTA
jgi:hypothetical protein